MATKNTAAKSTAKTTANTKETTMNDVKTVKTAEEKKADRIARQNAHRAEHDRKLGELMAQSPEPADFEVVWFINALEDERLGRKRPTSPLKTTGMYAEHDAEEVVFLRRAATLYGWEDNEYCTTSQAAKYQGHLKDEDAQGWELQSGDTFWFTAYPYSAFVWDTPSGKPEYDELKGAERDARTATRKAHKAEREAKAAEKKASKLRRAAEPAKEKAAPAKMLRITMADGTVLEAPTVAELKELKALYA